MPTAASPAKRAPANHSWRRALNKSPPASNTIPRITSGPSPSKPGRGSVNSVDARTDAIATKPSARSALGGPSRPGGARSRNFMSATVGRWGVESPSTHGLILQFDPRADDEEARAAEAFRHDDGFTRRRPGARPAQGLR